MASPFAFATSTGSFRAAFFLTATASLGRPLLGLTRMGVHICDEDVGTLATKTAAETMQSAAP